MEHKTVQAIASLSLDTIPPTFIFTDIDEHPHFADGLEIPVIDFGDRSSVVRKISEASKEWGIFQLVNHGIPDDVISKMQRAGKEFFELPQEEKMLVSEDQNSDSVEGYGSGFKMEVNGRGWVDHLFHYISPPSAVNYQFWPENPPSYRETTEGYGKRLHRVVGKVFECLSLDLRLEPQAVQDALGGDEQIKYLMKINYYPTCPHPELTHGVEPHTDMCAITVLVCDFSGLQVFQNECWFDVKYIPNALVVFVGEQLEILSNGRYKCAKHRSAVSKDKTRMSWPVFVEPQPEQEVGPIPMIIDEENPAKYKTNKYKDYAYSRLNLIAKDL